MNPRVGMRLFSIISNSQLPVLAMQKNRKQRSIRKAPEKQFFGGDTLSTPWKLVCLQPCIWREIRPMLAESSDPAIPKECQESSEQRSPLEAAVWRQDSQRAPCITLPLIPRPCSALGISWRFHSLLTPLWSPPAAGLHGERLTKREQDLRPYSCTTGLTPGSHRAISVVQTRDL